MATSERQWTLRRRFARLLLFAAVVPALLLSAAVLWQQYRIEHESLGERIGLSTSLTAASIDDFVHTRLAGLILLAQTRDTTPATWEEDLGRLLDAYPGLVTALVTDASGQVIAHAPAGIDRSSGQSVVDDREYFSVPARTLRPHVSNAFLGRAVGDDPLVAVSAPIVREGRFQGVVEASIHVDTFINQRGEAFRSRGYEMLLLDRRNRVIHTTAGLPYRFLDSVNDPRLMPLDAAPLHLSRTRFERDLLERSNAFVSRSRLASGWTLVLVAPHRSLLGVVGRSTLALLALLLLISLGVLAAAWVQLRDLTIGTGHLLSTLRNFAIGAPVNPESTRDMPMELRPVADAIGDLSGRLNRAYGELNDALQTQRELATSLHRVIEERDQEIADRTADLRTAVAELDRIASIDALTGAQNVRGFRREIGILVEDPGCADIPVGAMIVDIDHFKGYNDRYGHPAGDTVLKRVTGIMHSLLRGPTDTLARVGGEEFAILLVDADPYVTREVADRLRAAVHKAAIPHADGVDGRVTISIGIASQPSPELMDRLLSQADEALYRAKRNGRDQVSD